jgi:hypothetical protein
MLVKPIQRGAHPIEVSPQQSNFSIGIHPRSKPPFRTPFKTNTMHKAPKSSLTVQIPNDSEFVRNVVLAALESVDQARQKCLVAGYYLAEMKAHLPHGQFMTWVSKEIPEINHDTALLWMRAAANVAKALHMGASIKVDAEVIPMSRLLSAPEAELPTAAREMRQAWFDFTADKTIKDCISGVVVDGDPESRMKRAINGKLHGGTRGEDRKDWPTYIGKHLVAITGLLGAKEANREKRWQGLTPLQRQTIQDACTTALSKWPTPLVEHLAKVARHEVSNR